VILGINDLLQSCMGRNSMLNAELNIYYFICAHMGDFPKSGHNKHGLTATKDITV